MLSIWFGCLLWPHVRGRRKPTWSWVGELMSGNKGSMILRLPVKRSLSPWTRFILAKKYYLTLSSVVYNSSRCVLTPPIILFSWFTSLSCSYAVLPDIVENIFLVLPIEKVTCVNWSKDCIRSTLRRSTLSPDRSRLESLAGLSWMSVFWP